METPILFLIFNRPDTTQKVFERIREIQPKYLYIAADGPRKDKAGEYELCEQTRAIINVDWNCEVKTLYRDVNLGCGKGPSSAINWFFNHVEEGIILEDDCLPDRSFFTFCKELLDYYKDNDSIMHIGGTNSQFGKKRGNASYYFSKYPHIWGWATWKKSWQQFRFSFTDEDEQKLEIIFNKYKFTEKEKKYWIEHWNIVKEGKREDIWDIQWTFSCWLNNGISIVPNYNLISNIGFNETATHTKSKESKLANIATVKLKKIIHPNLIAINNTADYYTFSKYNLLESSTPSQIKNWISSKIPNSIKFKLKKIIR